MGVDFFSVPAESVCGTYCNVKVKLKGRGLVSSRFAH